MVRHAHRPFITSARSLASIGLVLALHAAAPAQGVTDYVNVESVACKPITVARFDDHDYLLVCNTPDNSLEIYDTSEGTVSHAFLQRLPVGLEPVSVVYDETTSRFYTANALGDSVSVGRLFDPPGAATFAAQLTATVNVGDEPTHLVVDTDRDALWVTLRSRSSLALLDRVTLQPKALSGTDFATVALNDRIVMTDVGVFVSEQGGTDGAMAVKQPHTVLLDDGGEEGRLLVLGFRGGGDPAKTGAANVFDLDVWGYDFDTEAVFTLPGADTPLGSGLGTTNYNMALASDGDLYVVSAEAQNHKVGNDVLSDPTELPTGFVTTLLHRVDALGTAGEAVSTLDLNDDGTGDGVDKDDAIAHATDIVIYEPSGGGTYACIVAMHSDMFAMVDVSASSPASWTIARLPIADPDTDPVRGPRGLALKYANASQTDDPGDRLYVMNRLENSVTVIDPTNLSSEVARFALQNDPRPDKQLDGQEFLYSTRFSGNGFVSCASCHVDGRTDGLGWFVTRDPDLDPPTCDEDPFDHFAPTGPASAFTTVDPAYKFEMSHGNAAEVVATAEDGFFVDKGVMVTQSLQGLVNGEMEDGFQTLVTNAPYHWRGDKPAFQDFNEAFVNLQDATNLASPDVCFPEGLTSSDMDLYTDFVNTIHYPPNPDQPLDRVYSGELGDPDDEEDGSGAQLGMKLFHTAPHIQWVPEDPPTPAHFAFEDAADITGGRSCVQCHSLPEGSNNRITDRLDGDMQHTETAQLRDLVQKEERYTASPTDDNVGFNMTNNWGFRHKGTAPGTINDFVDLGVFKGGLGLNTTAKVQAVASFVRELDWGMAPIVGQTITVTTANVSAQATTDRLDLFESQVKRANAGLAVYLRTSGTERAFWFRLSAGCMYQEDPSATGAQLTRAQLLSLVSTARDVAVFTATPLGSERRVAALDGVGDVLTGSAPNTIEFAGTTPNTAHVEVPTLSKNWPLELDDDPFDTNDQMNWPGDTFFWVGTFDVGTSQPDRAPHPLSLAIQRTFQKALTSVTSSDPNGPIVEQHDAPRRLVVTGNNIREGAKIAVFMNAGTPASPTWIPMLLNIHPRLLDEEQCGDLVWETHVEFEPEKVYMLRVGGLWADGVEEMFEGEFDERNFVDPFDITNWNKYVVYVQNEDTTQGANGGTPVPFLY